MTTSIVFDHAAIAAHQRDPIRAFVLDLFGGRVIVEQRGPMIDQGFRGVQIDIGGANLEIIEPTSPSSFLQPFLAKRGPGLHHLTWYVRALDSFLDRLTARGVPLTGVEREPDGRAANAFIRPSASYGVLLQFRPLEDKVRERQSPDWQDVPAPRPNRGRLAASSIAVPDGAAALAFFQETLGGAAEAPIQRGDALVRTLRTGGTTVELLSPADPNGPLAAEIAASGQGLYSLTFEIANMPDMVSLARSQGLSVRIGEDDRMFSLGRDNPTGARFRLVSSRSASE